LVTAAGDSPVKRTISARDTGWRVSTVVNTATEAGLVNGSQGESTAKRRRGMSLTYASFQEHRIGWVEDGGG
jgi:hypothetical protein